MNKIQLALMSPKYILDNTVFKTLTGFNVNFSDNHSLSIILAGFTFHFLSCRN